MDVYGTSQADNLVGSEGDDQFSAGGGNDYLFGLGGNDFFYWYAGKGNTDVKQSTIVDSDGSDVIDGGAGTDRFYVDVPLKNYYVFPIGGRHTTGKVTYTLEAAPDGSARFVSSQPWNSNDTGTSITTVTLKNIESLSLRGTTAVPVPQLFGTIDYNEDKLIVGDLRTTALTGAIIFQGEAGDDTLDASAAYNPIFASGGTGNDTLVGGAANDELTGGEGHDYLSGNGGTNTLVGGAGNDRYDSHNRADSVIEQAGEGEDAIYMWDTYYVLPANVEALTFVGTADFTGIGNDGANWVIGSSGNDYLIGLGGDDQLIGNGGANALQGGTGDDTYETSSAQDTLIEFAGEGHDTIRTTLGSYTLLENFEDLTQIGDADFVGTGNDQDNVLRSSNGSDKLYGLGGDDLLYAAGGASNELHGGAGNDTYIVESPGDVVVELANEGIDSVQTTLASYTLTTNVENLKYSGSGTFTAHGNALANAILGGAGVDNLYGAGGDDTLRGGPGGDFLVGESGNDRLIGGAGGDELVGQGGADRFVFEAPSDGKDLIHDFSRADGDKIDVAQLLASVGYSGADPFADGYLRVEGIAAFGSGGVPATKVVFDPDGTAGPLGGTDLAVLFGGTAVVDPADFIVA